MQQNGSSSLRMRGGARGGAEIDLRLERDDVLRAGRFAQPTLHAGVLDEAQHRPFGVVRKAPVGHADTQDKQSVQPGNVDFDGSERRLLGECE